MKDLLIIGICGKMGSGKSTLRDSLFTVLNTIRCKNKQNKLFNMEYDSLANKLKETVSFMFRSQTAEKNDTVFDIKKLPDKSEYLYKDKTFGRLLQLIGDGIRNSVDDEIWINLLLNKYTKPTVLLIDDVRYLNEANYIQNNEGIVIKCIRHADINSVKGRDIQHQSETQIDFIKSNIDYDSENNNSFEEILKFLSAKINEWVKQYDTSNKL